MNRMTRFALLFIMALLMAVPTFAQEPPAGATKEPLTVEEILDLPVVGTTEAGEPIFGVPVQPLEPVPTAIATQTPPPPAGSTESGTAQSVVGWMGLIITVLIVAILVLVFLLLRQKTKDGDMQAAQWLRMFEAARDTLAPRDSVNARIARMEADAEITPGMLDNILAGLVKAGVKIIYPGDQTGGTDITVNNINPTPPQPPTGS